MKQTLLKILTNAGHEIIQTLLKILTIVGLVILLGGIGLFCFKRSVEPKADPALYTRIVQKRMGQSDRYRFLPEAIARDAIRVAFFHVPGFLQGGDVIALRMMLPPAKIASLLNNLEGSGRTEISSLDGIPFHKTYPAYGMKKPGLKNSFEGVSKLPNDFRIFLDTFDIPQSGNHGIASFTAVSTNRNEVVYFIDDW